MATLELLLPGHVVAQIKREARASGMTISRTVVDLIGLGLAAKAEVSEIRAELELVRQEIIEIRKAALERGLRA